MLRPLGIFAEAKRIAVNYLIIVPEQSEQQVGVFSAMRNTFRKVIYSLQSQADAHNFELRSSIIQGKPWLTEDHS